ncbi:MAG: LysR family transcriptional regulator [Bdellovibrionaceae bacterium]|nr:LysR family transcriptional regulator [Pseudobdellovibrionaceae bacterium]
METNRLRQFCAVYETKNLRRAAELLGMSHGALHKSLQNLQDELKTQLYMQDGRGIAITDRGLQFYPRAKQFLESEDQLTGDLSKSSEVRFRIGTYEVFSTHLIGGFWSEFMEETQLSLFEMLPGRIEEALVTQKIDVGITYEPSPKAGVRFLKLGKVRMGIFVKKGAFLNLPTEEIPFVAPITPLESVPSGAKGLDGWPYEQIDRKVIHSVDMMESGLALVRNGSCAIFLPLFVAHIHNKTVKEEYILEEKLMPKSIKPTYRDVFLALRIGSAEDQSIKRISKLIRKICIER